MLTIFFVQLEHSCVGIATSFKVFFCLMSTEKSEAMSKQSGRRKD